VAPGASRLYTARPFEPPGARRYAASGEVGAAVWGSKTTRESTRRAVRPASVSCGINTLARLSLGEYGCANRSAAAVEKRSGNGNRTRRPQSRHDACIHG